jgi:hypothetical protein
VTGSEDASFSRRGRPPREVQGDLGKLIDLALHTGAADLVTRILEERGLTFFQHSPAEGVGIDPRRVELAVDLALRQLPTAPLPGARETCLEAVHRRLSELLPRGRAGAGH